MHQYRYKNALNIEYLHIRDRFFDSKHITCVIIVTDQETYKTESEAFGEFSEQITETVENTEREARETREKVQQMENTFADKFQNMDKRMQNVENIMGDIKSMLGTMSGQGN